MNNKFKIGDKVKVVDTGFNFKKKYIGDICEVIDIEKPFANDRGPRYVLSGANYIFYEKELELVKPKFDIKDYPGDYVIHVTSEEQAKIFCEYLHSIGRKWNGGNSYLDRTNYYRHGTRTCYEFNVNKYDDISWFKIHNFTILEFNDFDWSDFMKKEFTKADLKNGDVIKRRDGSVEIVCLESKTLICKSGWNSLDDVLSDLTDCQRSDYDIVAVRRPVFPRDCQFDAFGSKRGELVYERKEVEEMTLEEVCKALGKEIKIVKNK